MAGSGGNEADGRRRWITAGAYDSVSGTAIADTRGDLVAYGRWFISNVRVESVSVVIVSLTTSHKARPAVSPEA